MSSATRKRNRTWRTAPATAHRSSSASGSETSCTQRGTWIRIDAWASPRERWSSRRRTDPSGPVGCGQTCRPRAPTGGGGSNPGKGSTGRIEQQARSARRARRFALLVLLAAVFVVALALTAFGGAEHPARAARLVLVHDGAVEAVSRDRRAPRPGPAPAPDRAGSRDRDRLQRRERRPSARAGRPPGERGARLARLPRDLRRRRRQPALVPARRRRDERARRRRPDRDGRLLAGRRGRRRDPAVHRHGQAVRVGDRHPAAELDLARRRSVRSSPRIRPSRSGAPS